MSRRKQHSRKSSPPAAGVATAAAAYPQGGTASAAIVPPVPAAYAQRPKEPARAAPPTAATVAGSPYLDHPGRMAIVFGSFFVLCLPLVTALIGTSANASAVEWLVIFQTYSILVGYTHFAVTFSIYLNSANLAYFRSSPRNIAVYFVGPILILATFFAIGFLGVNQPAPNSSAAFLAYLFWFALLTKLADYLHVVRQSFGVLQLFKKHVRAPFPHWMRRTENAFFIVLMALQVLTFSEGLKANNIGAARFNFDNPWSLLGLALAVALLLAILCGHALMAKTLPAGSRRSLLVPLSYFLLQTASASLPVYWSVLYVASLAMHYVEYHVVMYPRIFQAPLASRGWPDRLALWFRSHKIVFYLALASFCYLFMGNGIEHLASVAPIGKQVTWLLLNLFNGIFMAHFFIEAFVWKFGVPFYRQTLGPLYFPPAKAAS